MKRDLFTHEHDAYRDSVRAFLAKQVEPHYPRWERAGIVPRELFTQLGALGALGFGVTEEFGGTGVDDFRYNMILQEEAARTGGATGHPRPDRLGPLGNPNPSGPRG